MFKKHIIFKILYIIVGPLCPASQTLRFLQSPSFRQAQSALIGQLTQSHIIILVLTDNSSVSVRFQKVFQNCISRFCVMRSNSVPLNSGSTTYLPDFSPKDTILMTTVCRKGLREGENLEQRQIKRDFVFLEPVCIHHKLHAPVKQ
uniref:Uncharacterized protein n=1 Tax=Sinocyclocheilus anshuiensis TaxID=1608454 RepID=A0A671LSM2_9TELE